MAMKVARSPSDTASLTNCVFVNDSEYERISKYVKMNGNVLLTARGHPDMKPGTMGFSSIQRKWLTLSLNQQITLEPFNFSGDFYISSMTVLVDFLTKPRGHQTETYDTDKMAPDFTFQFRDLAVSLGQPLGYSFGEKKILSLIVKSMEVANIEILKGGSSNPSKSQKASKDAKSGVIMSNTQVIFERAEGAPLSLQLTGKSKGTQSRVSLINPDWNFQEMGIGGLDDEFSCIFRRAFASRVFPPDVVEEMGAKHVKGILLFGPPGTGKTLMARQIGKMLNAREPQIINGPEILNKYVGESEANVRRLFAAAEDEQKKAGNNSGLHIIIFDEIDAICKQRGSISGSAGVHDTVVNQLLSKIDGVEQLNNILLIGMTNRRDLIDEALLRPGRLEVQMEIGLPDEKGRVDIFKIHIAKMQQNERLDTGVDIARLAKLTKNFSGAEIEGVVRAAQSHAMNRVIKADSKVRVDAKAAEEVKVFMDDFLRALEDDIKPAFGVSEEDLEKHLPNGVVSWGDPVVRILEDATLQVQQAKVSKKTPLLTVLLEGSVGSGKTALAVHVARLSEFPFVKVVSPGDMIGYTEASKCMAIKKIFDDAYKSQLSIIVLDDIERLIEFVAIGPRFSNIVVQTLLVLLKKLPPLGRRLLVFGTTSQRDVLDQMGLIQAFNNVIHVSNISKCSELISALTDFDVFEASELDEIQKKVGKHRVWIGIKKVIVLSEMARQMPRHLRVTKFLTLLQEEGGFEGPSL
ncbi:vesicle-fusing ATPase-like [Oscarella lobularis]|uniref:vesicle-fusing ATPase-like n=1 Tax=Oscarella lobularis TaxID=121494 RepID=UPI0033140EDB